jgi:hypothetical protein
MRRGKGQVLHFTFVASAMAQGLVHFCDGECRVLLPETNSRAYIGLVARTNSAHFGTMALENLLPHMQYQGHIDILQLI